MFNERHNLYAEMKSRQYSDRNTWDYRSDTQKSIDNTDQDGKWVLVPIIIAVIFFFYLQAIIDALFSLVHKLWAQLMLTMILSIFVGVIAFIVRQKFRRVFGFVELIFALFTSYYSANVAISHYIGSEPETQLLVILLQLGTTVFIVGRGLDNIVKSIETPWWIFQDSLEIRDIEKSTQKNKLLNARLNRISKRRAY